MLRVLLKDSAIYTIPALVSRGLSFFLIPLYTRVLSPENYGSLDLLMVFTSLANLTVALEVSQGVARFYTEESDCDRKAAYASSALWFAVGCYTVFTIFAILYSETLSVWVMGRSGLVLAFRIGIVYIWANGIFYLIQNQLRWELRSRAYAVVSLLAAFSSTIAVVGLTYGLKLGLEGLLFGQLVGILIGSVYGFWSLRHTFAFCLNRSLLKEMLIFSAPLVPSGITVFISNYIDRLMINHFLSLEDVGVYAIGFRLSSIIGLVIIGFQQALTPLIYTYYHKAETPKQLAKIFRLFLTLVLFSYIVIALFSHEILVVMTVPSYYSASRLTLYLSPAVLLSRMYIFTPGIGIARKTYLILWINFAGAFVNTILNWYLIPYAGVSGAALATFLGSACIFSIYVAVSQKLYPIPYDVQSIAPAIILTALLAWLTVRIGDELSMRLFMNSIFLTLEIAILLGTRMIKDSELKWLKTKVLSSLN